MSVPPRKYNNYMEPETTPIVLLNNFMRPSEEELKAQAKPKPETTQSNIWTIAQKPKTPGSPQIGAHREQKRE